MNIKKILPAIFLLTSTLIYSQEYSQRNDLFFNSIFDGKEFVNSYYVGNNPAFLKWEKSDQRLSVKTFYSNSEGDFKTFSTPEKEKLYQLTFTGKKEISETQIFKGSFSVLKNERYNWQWIQTKMYNTGSPFLFGDSTTGLTRYNIMNLNAQYSANVFNDFYVGFAIDYSVDEGLKKVSPRPTSEHRDIYFSLGAGYMLDKNTTIGLSCKVYDYNEKIIYAEDEGAVYSETILLKFKGYDYPARISKKTETRYSYYNKYFTSLDFQHLTDRLTVSGIAGFGMDNISVSDGSNDPIPAGYFRNNNFKCAVNTLYKLSNFWDAGLYYSFEQNNMWSRHASYDIITSEEKIPLHKIGAGFQLNLTKDFSAGVEFETQISKRDTKDYYSNIYWQSDIVELTPRIGFNYKWNEKISTFLSYAYSNHKASNPYLSVKDNTIYFSNYRILDVEYYLTNYTCHSLYLKIDLDFSSVGSFSVYALYKTIIPTNSARFTDVNRNFINAGIEYKVLVY